MNDICIYQQYPGLGDHLQHSTLPRLFSSLGHNVYISNKCQYRNEEIKKLVWESNPYVAGFSDMPPNAGMSCSLIQEEAVKVWKSTGESIKNIEAAHRFYLSKSKPEVHYQPKSMFGLDNYLVLDATALTCFGSYKKEKIIDIVRGIQENNVLTVKSTKLKYNEQEDLSSDVFGTIYVNSIFEYCDVISSCGTFVSLMSGGHSLAQALRTSNNFCIIEKNLFDVHFQKGLFLNESAVTYLKF
jgi:hypothetical protein